MPASTAISIRSPVTRVSAFEEGLLTLLRAKHADILEAVRKSSDLKTPPPPSSRRAVDGVRQDVHLT